MEHTHGQLAAYDHPCAQERDQAMTPRPGGASLSALMSLVDVFLRLGSFGQNNIWKEYIHRCI